MDTTVRELERLAAMGDERAAGRLERERARAGEIELTRWFMRCGLCLSVVAVETENRPTKTECGLCGGTFEIMGRVQRDRLVKNEGERCPCDERCTHAAGPKCVCSCAARNHGTGLVVPFVVTGSIPKLTPMRKGAEALARAEEFKKAIAEARELADRMPLDSFGRRSWTHYRTVSAINASEAARSHKGRMTKLAAVVAQLKGGAA